jgi:hypothetical protein
MGGIDKDLHLTSLKNRWLCHGATPIAARHELVASRRLPAVDRSTVKIDREVQLLRFPERIATIRLASSADLRTTRALASRCFAAQSAALRPDASAGWFAMPVDQQAMER